MKYLFFDVETTGVDAEWDNVVQLAAVLTDGVGLELASMDRIVRPDDFTIPRRAAAIHGITTQIARIKGIAIEDVLSEFLELVEQSDYLVAHNFSFDYTFLKVELERAFTQEDLSNQGSLFPGDTTSLKSERFNQRPPTWWNQQITKFKSQNNQHFFCTMRSTTEVTKIGYNPKYKSYKWPKLEELHRVLFGEPITGAHNAMVDVQATLRCFFELKGKRGMFG